MIKLTTYFLKHPRVTNMVVVLLFLAGILSALTLTRQSNPSVSFDIINITTIYPGASPEDVEINVTNKIEDQLLEVENIKNMTSMSMENMSMVTVQIDSDAGVPDEIKTNIRDAVGRVSDLPSSVTQKPVISEMKASNFPVLEIALQGEVSELELRKYVKDLESRFREVRGVGKITKMGFRKREVHIDIDLEKMKENRVSFAEVMNAIRSRNVRATGGTIESFVSEKKIVTLSEYDDSIDVGEVIIRSTFTGNRLKISDIADVYESFEEPRVLYRGNGKPSIGLSVTSQDNADVIDMSDDLHEVLANFKNGLPKEVGVIEIFDYSIYTRMMVNMVINNGLFGVVLVFIVMFIFLDLKSAFWSAFGIPFSLLGSLVLFVPFGMNLNNITLVTMILVLGIIVDDAIVITEKVFSLKKQGLEYSRATIEGVKEMALPLSASIMTTILAFMPILFISGIFGKFLATIPIVVMITLSFSWLESLFFLPAHIQHTIPPEKTPKRSLWIEKLIQIYSKAIKWALGHRVIVLIGYTVLFVAVIALSKWKLDFILNQDRDSDFFNITIEAKQGTSLAKTKDLVPIIEKLVEENVPQDILKSFSTNVGHHDSIVGINTGQYSNWAVVTVYLIPAEQRKLETEELIKKLEPKVKELKEKHGFQRLSIEPLDGGLNTGKPIDVTYITNDDTARNEFEKKTIEYLKNIKGVSSVESSNVPGKDELRLKLDYKKLAQVGLTAVDVAATVRSAFDGTIVTSIRKAGEEIDFRVRLKEPKHFRAEGVMKLPIANAQGQLVPLGVFAEFDETLGPSVIHHTSGKRAVRITGEVEPKVITPKTINEKLRNEFEKQTALIPGFRMKFGGQEEEMMISLQGFYFALIVAVLSIYFLLVVLFDSYLQPFIIMSIIPFAVLGVLLTLIMHNMPLTFVAMIGMLGLIGVVVNDTIVMISHINKICEKEGYHLKTVAKGAIERFRPVILTTLTTFAGLLPTSYGIGGDLPDIRPMVLTMAWGLIFTTMITLGFIPIVYSYVTIRKKKTN